MEEASLVTYLNPNLRPDLQDQQTICLKSAGTCAYYQNITVSNFVVGEVRLWEREDLWL